MFRSIHSKHFVEPIKKRLARRFIMAIETFPCTCYACGREWNNEDCFTDLCAACGKEQDYQYEVAQRGPMTEEEYEKEYL
jgi:rRNA maturation endonuclease Nob1